MPRPEASHLGRAVVVGRAALAIAALAVWEVAAGPLHLAGPLVPPPTAVAARAASDGLAFYAAATGPTLLGAWLGWIAGCAAGISFAAVAAAMPSAGRVLNTLALTAFCIPGVALGPILAVTCSPEETRVVLAALPIAYLTMETLRVAAPPTGLRDAVRAFGGSRWDVLRVLSLPAAVPSLVTALRVAVPFALLGAVSADFLGAERGLGVVLVTAQHRLMPDRAWAVALLLGVSAALPTAALGWIGRRAAPWSPADVPTDGRPEPVERRPAASGAFGLAAEAAAVLGTWSAAPRLLKLSPFIAKGPFDVLGYLLDPAHGAERCGKLLGEIAVTAGDILAALACGTALAVVCAAATTALRPLRVLLIGPALMAQCLPVVAFTPLLVLAFGRGVAVVIAVGTLVVFVPVVLGLWAAFSRVPRPLTDLAEVHAASRARLLLTVLVPASVPALLASVRMSVPLACAGALLAEWLATGRGAGYGMLAAAAASDYAAVWAGIAATTGMTILLYGSVRVAELRLLARWGGTAS